MLLNVIGCLYLIISSLPPLPIPITRGNNVNSPWLRQIASFIKLSTKKYKCYSLPYSRELPKINANEIIKIVIFGFTFTAFLFYVFLSTCRTATFICFSTNLSISTRAISRNWVPTRFYLLTIAAVLLTDVNDFIVIFLHIA